MSFKSSIIKKAIKWTPTKIILWVTNIMLKGIAELTDFRVDIDARTSFVQLQLFGEAEVIEVWLEGFAVINHEESYQFILQQAKSNRLWLDNIFARIVGKAWKIPVIPQLTTYMPLIAELLNVDNAGQSGLNYPEDTN
ncbi:MAG: hypothetical protein HOP02_06110 [Methylococcaceae bacterium]|nr:hypothetical protein [Methylococcaceae bacterium]